ncbi:MAG: PQQ-binding-like beta-propeller repeat protein [Pseudomonadota bacterium]
MTTARHFRVAILIAGALAASGCSIFKRGKAPSTPVLGQRVPVLSTEGDVQADPATRELPLNLPEATANADWAQSGGNATKSMGHLALGRALAQAFSVQAGRGATATQRLAASPIAANGRVYVIDTGGAVRAFDGRSGGQLWASQTPNEKGNETSLYGGGLAYEAGRIYATNGLGYVAALDERTGGILWKVKPGGPLRGAPTVAGDTLYVMSQDNQLYSLKQADGTVNWSVAASLEIAGVFGAASPAVGQGTVVAGFSSGELNAYRYENARQVWQDALQRTSILTSVSSLSDIDADPVIDNGQVFAIGQGGRMVALELTTGQRQWELNIAGISTPWVAGDWVFVVTADAKLLCVQRTTGKVRWINPLPEFRSTKKKKGQIDYTGPILAGGRLIVTSTTGALINFDPDTGSFQSQTNVGAPVSVSPIVAGNTLYVLDDNGRLHAFR